MDAGGGGSIRASARVASRFTVVLAFATAPGCAPADDAPAAGRTDPPASGWEIGGEPTMVAGGAGATPEELTFHQVNAVVRLGDGRIVVADGGLRARITVLSPTGEYRSTIGRYGQGPGEFTSVSDLHVGPDDSLFVFDLGLQRLTVLSPDLEVVRVASYRGAGDEMLGEVVRLDGDVWIGRGRDRPLQGPVGELVRDTVVLGLLDGDLARFRPLARLPSLMSTTVRIGGRLGFGGAPFTPRVLQAAWGRCAFVTTAEGSEVDVYAADGERIATLQGPGKPRPVSAEDVAAWHEYRLRNVPEEGRPQALRSLEDAARPTQLPFYNQMLVDPRGHIWLQEYVAPVGRGDLWYVMSQNGRLLAEVRMPVPITAHRIDDQGVLGVMTGELDEERIVELPMLARPTEDADVIPACR